MWCLFIWQTLMASHISRYAAFAAVTRTTNTVLWPLCFLLIMRGLLQVEWVFSFCDNVTTFAAMTFIIFVRIELLIELILPAAWLIQLILWYSWYCENYAAQFPSVIIDCESVITRNSSGDEIVNVNFFMTTLYMYYKIQKLRFNEHEQMFTKISSW